MWRIKPWVVWTALPFIIAGSIFIALGVNTDPEAKTDDGYSLKWFWYVMGAWFIGLTVLLYAGIFYFVARSARTAEKIHQTGLRGVATILSSGATGDELNNMPQMEMELRVDVEGIPTYGVTHREYVNPVNLPALRTGSQVAVLVDPSDSRKLMIDWR